MEINVILNLQDHNEESHKKKPMKLKKETTIEEIGKKIKLIWGLDENFQELYFNRNQILDLDLTIERMGLQNNDQIVVKHSMLFHWQTLLEREISFHQTYDENLKRSIFIDVQKLIKVLEKCDFFIVYPSFGTRRFKIEKMFIKHFDREAIKNSSILYFKKLYGESAKITFESREDGSRSGVRCVVNNDSTIINFYIKTHHGAGDKNSNTRYDIDLRELFVYKFLENLKIGAHIHFINNELPSRWMVYIGSQEIPKFRTLELIELTEPQTINIYSKAVVEMLFLFSVMMLGDHHTGNLGVNDKIDPFIVDFFIIGRPMINVKDLYESLPVATKFNSVLGTFDEKFIICLNFLKTSNFMATLENTAKSFIEEEKADFDKSLLVFNKVDKTNDLLEYIENIKKNIKLFSDFK